jgi:hypothetical protein
MPFGVNNPLHNTWFKAFFICKKAHVAPKKRFSTIGYKNNSYAKSSGYGAPMMV